MKNLFLSNLKLKDWALIVLTGVAVFFFINYTISSSGYKKEIKILESESKDIQKKRDELDKQNKDLKKEAVIYIDNIDKYQKKINDISDLISKKDIEIKNLKLSLNQQRKEIEKTKKKIDELEKTPIKRTGQELLESIKEKTK
jgi:chromosome segregation ATPase